MNNTFDLHHALESTAVGPTSVDCLLLSYLDLAAGYILYAREVATTIRQQMGRVCACVSARVMRVAHLALLARTVFQCLAVEKSALWTITRLLHY